MLQFELKNKGQVLVDFYHSPYMGPNEPRKTTCEITTGWSLLNGIIEGVNYCSSKDNFCRASGRRISFDRAVSQIEDRNLRMLIRKEFHRVEGIPFNE